jgi:DNA-binding ferritin-like protein
MPKLNKITKKQRNGTSQTRKNTRSSKVSILRNFEREITVNFFEMLLLIKLYHWKTHSYATHKATDELYSKFNENMDKFIEVLLGKTGMRIDLTGKKQISLYDLSNTPQLINKVNSFKSYLVNLTNNKAINLMSNTDLLNIRDEMLGDMNQFLYLLSFNK